MLVFIEDETMKNEKKEKGAKKENAKMIRKEVVVPEGVTVTVADRAVTVKGMKGELRKEFDNPKFNAAIEMKADGNFSVVSSSDRKIARAMAGTIASHVKNMIIGVTKGHEYTMKIHYSHFPINVEIKDGKVFIKNFLGEKAPRTVRISGSVEVKAGKDSVVIRGANLEDVGQTALSIEQRCRISGRDRRVFNDGIYIDEKKNMDAR